MKAKLRLMFGLLLFVIPMFSMALELGACESERNKIVVILKSVFTPYLLDHQPLSSMGQDIIDLSSSMSGWVEDIDDCYRTVFRQYGAPVNYTALNNGLDWSSQLVALNDVIQDASKSLQLDPNNEELWNHLDRELNKYLPEVFVPSFFFDAAAL
ncbi:hypothetical protein BTA51_18005 [Hahella sp. CCB-MM4]|uniref:hypothetical protein n=1 Tax=Hahella sp. (strain CCB-MM4) TaxID=1926491 RepID=UPI000B9B0BD0|nr:hypothetical protein [Hahella sp. CCB-MM4]OZG71901.1 hypothetical protein BTA51_18005 [Hahella sp. CCB-MM4]